MAGNGGVFVRDESNVAEKARLIPSLVVAMWNVP